MLQAIANGTVETAVPAAVPRIRQVSEESGIIKIKNGIKRSGLMSIFKAYESHDASDAAAKARAAISMREIIFFSPHY